jgi:hypothetical protein
MKQYLPLWREYEALESRISDLAVRSQLARIYAHAVGASLSEWKLFGAWANGYDYGHANRLIGEKSDLAWFGVQSLNDYVRYYSWGYRQGWDEGETMF